MTRRNEFSPPRDRRVLRAVAVVVTAFVVGMAVPGLVGNGTGSATTARPAAAPGGAANGAGPGPTEFRGGIPVGFAHTGEGARAAAAAYVVTGETMLDLAPTRVEDAVRTMAASGSADAQVTELQGRLADIRELLAGGTGPTRYLQVVLATRIDGFTPERARVSVWSVGVLSRDGAAPPQAGWTISAFELVWERGDWKVWSETVTAGPTPELNAGAPPATARELDTALHGFSPWGSRP